MENHCQLANWNEVLANFKHLFGNLGEITENNSSIGYNSMKPDVETSIIIFKNGSFSAAMPLHGIGARVDTLTFTSTSLSLSGDNLDYTYKIRPAILLNNPR